MSALKATPSRHWTFPCPVCGMKVRVNKNGTIGAHFAYAERPTYCEGSRACGLWPGCETMSALNDYADVTRRAALKALGKRFMRGTDEPDPEAYRIQLHAIGCLDDTEISWMLTGWAILREEGAQIPDSLVAARAAAAETWRDEPASDAQWNKIRRECKEANKEVPQGPLNKGQASDIIEALAAGTYEPVPF